MTCHNKKINVMSITFFKHKLYLPNTRWKLPYSCLPLPPKYLVVLLSVIGYLCTSLYTIIVKLEQLKQAIGRGSIELF